ncbi:unnamed protein product [Amoebophrya sp. A25]|nr:unnamed protein product [Amoebophrya sp. A25]|eukprot:GSA25T00016166001.1
MIFCRVFSDLGGDERLPKQEARVKEGEKAVSFLDIKHTPTRTPTLAAVGDGTIVWPPKGHDQRANDYFHGSTSWRHDGAFSLGTATFWPHEETTST